MRAVVVVALALLSGAAEAGEIVIHDPWARASPGSAPNSAAYMVLEVTGDRPDRLLGGETPAAAEVQLHSHQMDDGVARMRQIDAVELAPGAPAVFEPGGLHLMLVDLRRPLVEGETVPIRLQFETAGAIEIEVPVYGLRGPVRDRPAHPGEHQAHPPRPGYPQSH